MEIATAHLLKLLRAMDQYRETIAECDAAVRDFNVCMAIDDGQVPPRFFNGSDEVFGEMARGLDDSE